MNTLNKLSTTINCLNNNHHYDPATWPRAVLGVSCALVFIWMSLGLRWVWAEEPTQNANYDAIFFHADSMSVTTEKADNTSKKVQRLASAKRGK